MYPLPKDTSGSEWNTSSSEGSEESEASEECVLQEVGSDTSDDDNIHLTKLAADIWSDRDRDVPLSVLRKNSFPYEPRFMSFSYTKCAFLDYATKTSAFNRGGLYNFQPSFRGGSTLRAEAPRSS